MQYRKVGNTGIVVSSIALGTMYFGDETPEQEAFHILDTFVEAGGNLVDTADVYVGGVAEQVVGRWLAARPREIVDRVVLATKARFGTGPDVNDVGLSRRHLHRALDASRRRLGVETIDLYQLHAWDPHTPVEETLAFLDDAVTAGKIHYVGLSNFTGWRVQLIASTAQAMGCRIPVSLQQQYSLLSRESEWEVIPAALHNEIGLLPWSPLAGGFLAGKYLRGGTPASVTRSGCTALADRSSGRNRADRRCAYRAAPHRCLGRCQARARSRGHHHPRQAQCSNARRLSLRGLRYRPARTVAADFRPSTGIHRRKWIRSSAGARLTRQREDAGCQSAAAYSRSSFP
jgi:aryl-alcohol dehydrogenase-like predicted oxidoreductase